MIQNFFTVLQEDAAFLYKNPRPLKVNEKSDLNTKIWLTYFRILGSAIMGTSIVLGLMALRTFVIQGNILYVALAALGYAIGHDIFTASLRASKLNGSFFQKLKLGVIKIARDQAIVKEISKETFLLKSISLMVFKNDL